MNRTKDIFGAISFFVALIALSPILITWWAWDKMCGRDFWEDLNEMDD